MGKKKNDYFTNSIDICDAINDRYVDDDNMSTVKNLINKIPQLIESNLAGSIVSKEYIESSFLCTYRFAAKFMQKYNKSIKKYRRNPRKFEFGDTDTLKANYDKKLIDLTKYILEDGKYFAQLDDTTYAVLILDSIEDGWYIQTSLYFIGNKWRKWKSKFNKKLKKYMDMRESTKTESISGISDGSFTQTIFKSFDQYIFTDKDKILKYIDNWKNNIPIYYEKYNMIPKLSILLHGEPGTGKSTFYKALAKYLEIDNITTVTLDHFMRQNTREGGRGQRQVYRSGGTVFAIDDIDCICKSREGKNDKNNDGILQALLAFLDNPPTFNMTANNGIQYPVSIVVATTNYYDKLDPAVKRHGRFDLTLEMKNFNRKEAQKMCDIYGLKLEDIVEKSHKSDFRISPSKLQAICLENVDNSLKGGKVVRNGLVVIHRRKNNEYS